MKYYTLWEENTVIPKLFSSNTFPLISFKDLPVRKNYKVFSFRFCSLWSDLASYKYLKCMYKKLIDF